MIYFDKSLEIILNTGKESSLYSDSVNIKSRHSHPYMSALIPLDINSVQALDCLLNKLNTIKQAINRFNLEMLKTNRSVLNTTRSPLKLKRNL